MRVSADSVQAATGWAFQEFFMVVHPIRTGSDHDAAVARIEALWGAKPGTEAHDGIEVLAVFVSAYKDARWLALPPDPVEAIEIYMEQNGFRQKDLASISRVLEIFNRRRLLTAEMIRAIHAAWSIPLESLVGATARAA